MGTLSINVVLALFVFTNYNPRYGHPWDTLDSIRAVCAVISSSHVGKTTVPFSNAGRQLFAVTRSQRPATSFDVRLRHLTVFAYY
jgi:hypothetical protein